MVNIIAVHRVSPGLNGSAVRSLRDGAREMLPLLVAVTPLGLVVGVAVAENGLPRLAGWSLSWLVYAASAQLAAVRVLADGGPAVVVVLAVVIVNMRLALYAAALAPHWRGTPRWWRALASYLLVDPSFAVATRSYDGSRRRRDAHLHYLGGALVLWLGWQVVTGAGVTLGAVLPASLQLDAVGPLYLVAVVAPQLRDCVVRSAAAAAATVAVAAALLPLQLGLAAGIVAGLVVGSRQKRSVS